MSFKIYGIKQCDTMKKAISWLNSNNIPYNFHDYKKQNISEEKLEEWLKKVDWEILVNKRGTTWRKLSDEVKLSMDKNSAIKEMINNPSIIKRPVLEFKDKILIGFSEDEYKSALSKG